MFKEINDSDTEPIKITQKDKAVANEPVAKWIFDYEVIDRWDSDYTPPYYHTSDEFDFFFPKQND